MENIDKFYEKRTLMYFDEMTRYKNLYEYVRKVVSREGRVAISEYFDTKKFKKIIIYGSGLMGKILFDVLSEEKRPEDIKIYDMNQNREFGIDSFVPKEELIESKDACVVITPLSSDVAIKKELDRLGVKNRISLLEILEYKKVAALYENGIPV